ncbi:hypothetical protein [Gluconobacter japonicus]|uniref:hypothetical protein n=1 Tax=Gluconobacter japonicus TaxID=376620 RepID=UPI0039E75602
MMRETDFFFNNPHEHRVCDEQRFTTRLQHNFCTYVDKNQEQLLLHEAANNPVTFEFQYNHVKSSRGFRAVFDQYGYDRALEMFSELLNNGRGSVIPDLCYHDPENITHNRLVVEVKCGSTSPYSIYHDLRKLRLYTDPEVLNFQTGIFLHVLSPNIDPIISVKNWVSRNPRSVPINTPNYDELRNNNYIATPAPVFGISYYIWRINNPVFGRDGFFNTNCIEEIEINSNSFDGSCFV